jgi:hypothetical protein
LCDDSEKTFRVPNEPLSPELVLVDPELAARARAALPDRPTASPHRWRPAPGPARAPTVDTPQPAAAPTEERHRRAPYPLWARVAAVLWVLAFGIMVGGTAVPHAQDRPRVVPPEEDAIICELPQARP